MLMCLVGAATALLELTGIHNRQLEALPR